MVFQRSDFRPELFPNRASLVNNDPNRTYLLTISEEELRNDEIETKYGPFDTTLENTNTPSPNGTPRLRNDEAMNRRKTIEDLRRMIAEREAAGRSYAATTTAESFVQQPPVLSAAAAETLTQLIQNNVSVATSSTSKLDSVPPEESIVLSGDSDDMSIDSLEDVQVSREGNDSGEINHNESSSNNSNHSPAQDVSAAIDSLTQEEEENNLALLTSEQRLAKFNIRRLTNELQQIQVSRKELQVKLLGIKVRMSMSKSRNETPKNSSSKPSTPVAEPSIGNRRDYFSANDYNNNYIPRYLHQRHSRRRMDYHGQSFDIYGYNATVEQSSASHPFYQQLPPQALVDGYIPSQQASYSQSHNNNYQPLPPPPPPPPPSGPPPQSPPPPPPPPAPSSSNYDTMNKITSSYPHGRKSGTQRHRYTAGKPKIKGKSLHVPPPPPDESSGIEPITNGSVVDAALKEIEQFVSLRIFNDNTNDYPVVQDRPLARPLRLSTIDGYTMSSNVIIIDKDKDSTIWQPPSQRFILPAGIPMETEMDKSWFESPLFVMLRRRAENKASNKSFSNAIDSVFTSIPIDSDLRTLKMGSSAYFVNLEEALLMTRSYVYQHPKNEFLAALKLELSHYVHGNNAVFLDDYHETITTIPLSIDVEWQRIRVETAVSNQLPLILDLLHRIATTHTTADAKESLEASSMTAEVLIRILRMNGLGQVLKLMTTHKAIYIDTEKENIFSLDDSPSLYLQEQDKYTVWMLILYYFINNKTLPENVCSVWMNTLVKEGLPNKHIPFFMIDWSHCGLLQQPLDKATLFGAINILLSMLRHFGNKACNNVGRKPLLVGVWRTLFSFLSQTPNYKIAGTLLLIRKYTSIVEQIPEIQEIVTTLEMKAGNETTVVTENIYESKKKMSESNVFTLSHFIAHTYYEKQPFSKSSLLVMANILLYPQLDIDSLSVQRDFLTRLCKPDEIDTYDDEEYMKMIGYVRQYYATALDVVDKLNDVFPEQQDRRMPVNKQQRKMTFAWINILLLTQMCKSLYPVTTNQEMRDKLDQEFNILFQEALQVLDSTSEKLIIMKYADQYIHL